MKRSPVSITLLVGVLLAFAWVLLTIQGSSSVNSDVYSTGADPESESPIPKEDLNQRLKEAQAAVTHHANWSFLMTVPHR